MVKMHQATDSDLDAMLNGFDAAPVTVFEENLDLLKDQRLALVKTFTYTKDDIERRKIIEKQLGFSELRVASEADVRKILQILLEQSF